MTENDVTAFTDALTVLGEIFDTKLSAARRTAYFEALADLDWLAVEVAMRCAMRQCKFFPKPAELRELIEGTLKERAEQAWLEVNEIFRDYGPHHGLLCQDPLFAEAIRIVWVDWIDACRYLRRGHEEGGAALYALHQDFVNAYKLATERELPQRPVYFHGLREVWAEKSLPPIRMGRGLQPALFMDESQPALPEGNEAARQHFVEPLNEHNQRAIHPALLVQARERGLIT